MIKVYAIAIVSCERGGCRNTVEWRVPLCEIGDELKRIVIEDDGLIPDGWSKPFSHSDFMLCRECTEAREGKL